METRPVGLGSISYSAQITVSHAMTSLSTVKKGMYRCEGRHCEFTPIGRWIFLHGVEYRAALRSAMLVGEWGATYPVCRTPVVCVSPRSGLGIYMTGSWGVGESGVGIGGGVISRLKRGHHPHVPSTYIRMSYPAPFSPLFHSEFGGERRRTEARQKGGSRSALGVCI